MLRKTKGLATMTLAAGLVLGTAGLAAADTGMSGSTGMSAKTLISTHFQNLTLGELSKLDGHEIYDAQGGKVGTILRLVRGEKTHQFYYVVSPDGFIGDQHGTAAVPVKDLRWVGKDIVLAHRFLQLPLSEDTVSEPPLQNFVYTGDTWSPTKA